MAQAELVAGIDSSTQSTKVVIRDASTGELIRSGRASHPAGTEIDPTHWWRALHEAIDAAGGLGGVAGLSIAGQQHGMVALDESGEVIRPALLWNDTRSALEAEAINSEYAGAHNGESIASAVGSKLVAAFTASKVRWLADHETENASRIAALALPHDWLTWKLKSSNNLEDLITDRSDASGTGYFDSVSNQYRRDILELSLRNKRDIALPKVLGPLEQAGVTQDGVVLGVGCGDNAGAALGIRAIPGDVVISLGTSGTAFSVSATPTHDPRGYVAGFADASGGFLPLVCTLNAARVLDAGAKMLGLTLDEFGERALAAKPGAEGLLLLPYLEGERTPDRPNATGVFAGLTIANSTSENIARAMIEGMLCGLVDAVSQLEVQGVAVNRILIIGGAAKNPAIAPIASALLGRSVLLPEEGEYVADGAAYQIARTLRGSEPEWNEATRREVSAPSSTWVVEKYLSLVERTSNW